MAPYAEEGCKLFVYGIQEDLEDMAVVVVVTKLLNINPKCSRILAPNYHLPFLCIYQYLERSACLS